ncbi:hypothetical protein QUC31_003611 [Theobroma cacao]|uniref:Chaperone DnaJ-domain superfamily protein, putative n=1 Tax=Theobroma cacao TaxID=3641 RepID=A0A061DIH1_THECC|nr:Chaperone DnaJ-domain superfamily protein, putative [Theobroma cacao]
MQISRWRNVLVLKNSLVPAFLPSEPTATVATTHVASFHSTPVTCEKWKNKWNYDEKRAQQPSKTYVRYAVRQKRADAKRALKDLLFNTGSSNISFQDDDPIWKFDGTEGQDSDGSNKKWRSRFPGRRAGKSNHKKIKRRFRRESFSGDFDHPETIFQATFGNKWYTWSSRGESSFQNSESGYEWREKSGWTNQRRKQWETMSETESEDESCAVGSCSDRSILGLPPTGPLKIEDVKNAFRLSALKWHPDKHQGPSQAMAEEKFKLCVDAYKSLCNALA